MDSEGAQDLGAAEGLARITTDERSVSPLALPPWSSTAKSIIRGKLLGEREATRRDNNVVS